jgi:hypothetical protein
MINKLIVAVVGLILLALVVKGITAGNGYLAEVESAAQARSAAYQQIGR